MLLLSSLLVYVFIFIFIYVSIVFIANFKKLVHALYFYIFYSTKNSIFIYLHFPIQRYAADFNLGTSKTTEEKEEMVNDILKEFGLVDQKYTIIGTPIRKGCSGGQVRFLIPSCVVSL